MLTEILLYIWPIKLLIGRDDYDLDRMHLIIIIIII